VGFDNRSGRGAESKVKAHLKETEMTWTKPEFVEIRFGFEVTMYIWTR
jgi:coenzyme PQQ precursor peptide PqqA